MKNRKPFIAMFVIMLLAAASASAQTRGVSLRPVLKVGEESRYVINGSVDEQVTPTGANGIAGKVHREVSATVLLRAGLTAPASLGENATPTPRASITDADTPGGGLVYYEASIEAFETHTIIDGVEKPSKDTNIVGQKIEFAMSAAGNVVKCAYPSEVVNSGLVEMIFSLNSWAPIMPPEVGTMWGSIDGKPMPKGGYGYITMAKLSDISRRAYAAYTLTSFKEGLAVVEGIIELRQDGASALEFPVGPTRVNVIASGSGNSHIEVDVASSRIVSATSETVFNGKLVNIQPTRAGEKMQPREGALVETAKFSIKLIP